MRPHSDKAILVAGIPSTSTVAASMHGRGYAIDRVGNLDEMFARLETSTPQMVLIAADLIPGGGRQALLARLRQRDRGALVIFESLHH